MKVILLNVEDCDEELSRTALNKMARALVTLATVDSAELRYVALRNLRLVIQKVPNLLSKNIQVFFCKYNDPIYVKMEKLELLISLATPKYMEKILNELKEWVCWLSLTQLRDGGGYRLRPRGRAGDRPLCAEGRVDGGQVRVGAGDAAAEPHQLRGAGGGDRHPRYLPQVPR